MKILHSIAYLMLPIAIINNNSYTMDDKQDNGDTPEYNDPFFIDINETNDDKEQRKQNPKLFANPNEVQDKFIKELTNNNKQLYKNFSDYVDSLKNIIGENIDVNMHNKSKIEYLLTHNSILENINKRLSKLNNELFEEYCLVNCNNSIIIDQREMKLFVANPKTKIFLPGRIYCVLNGTDNDDVIRVTTPDGKINFNQELIKQKFKELQNNYKNGYYSILKYYDEYLKKNKYYLAYTVDNQYFKDIYSYWYDVSDNQYKLKKIQYPLQKQYNDLNKYYKFGCKYNNKSYTMYTLPENTTIYVHENLDDPQSKLINIANDLQEEYYLDNNESIGILEDCRNGYYYLIIYHIDENNKIYLRDINNEHKMKFLLNDEHNIYFKYDNENYEQNNNINNKNDINEEENAKYIEDYEDNDKINQNNDNENSKDEIEEEENQEEYSNDEQEEEYYKGEKGHNNNQIKIKKHTNEIIINKIHGKYQQSINNDERILNFQPGLDENISVLFEMIDTYQKSEENKELINNFIKDTEQLKQIILNKDFIKIITNKNECYNYLSKKGYGFLWNTKFMDLIQYIIFQYNEIQNMNKDENYNFKINEQKLKDKNEIIINNYEYIEENKIIENKNQNLQLQQQNEVIKLENKLKSITQEIKNKKQEIIDQYNVIKQKLEDNQEEQNKFNEHFGNLITSKEFLQNINKNEFINKYFEDKKYKIPEK